MEQHDSKTEGVWGPRPQRGAGAEPLPAGGEPELAEIIATGAPIEIRAGGTKRPWGRPATGTILDISALRGILDYDPAELVLTARAATPLAEIESALAQAQQTLAFEPPDWRALLGTEGEPTLGGTIAVNASGPRRIRAGAARDHLLGFRAIDGTGQIWKAGGRVVKNVTGYDMSKLMAGAFGTLSLLTELSVRVLPRPETETTLLFEGETAAGATAAMTAALNTPHEISAAAWLPADIAARTKLAAATSLRLLRLEGPAQSVAYRAGALGGTQLDAATSQAIWRDIASVAPLLPPAGRCIWRLCTAPALAPALRDRVQATFEGAETFLDWGGGLLWASLPKQDAATALHALLHAFGGHATLIAASQQYRAGAVFQPRSAAQAALEARIKRGFDPGLVLNRFRMSEAW